MIDWRSRTLDPNDSAVKKDFYKFLLQKRKIIDVTEMDITGLFSQASKGRRVLDIGMGEHSIEYVNKKQWKHEYIKNAASYILGVDILEPLVESLIKKGYNVKCMDATGDGFLGEMFDTVICGDVIEHVNNPVKLLEFAGRHINDTGNIIVSTPNPFYWYFIKRIYQEGTFVANFEHTLWLTPSNAVELAYRAGLELKSYSILVKNKSGSPIKRLIKKLLPIEMRSIQYVFEFKKKS